MKLAAPAAFSRSRPILPKPYRGIVGRRLVPTQKLPDMSFRWLRGRAHHHKAEIRQKMLNQELNHRVKNILALIKSIVAHPLAEGARIEAYVTSLKGRIEALAVAHDRAMRASGGGLLLDLVNAEASPIGRAAARSRFVAPPSR